MYQLLASSLACALSHPVQGVTHATLAAHMQNHTEQTASLSLAFGGGVKTCVCACQCCQTGVAWCEMDMRGGCEAALLDAERERRGRLRGEDGAVVEL